MLIPVERLRSLAAVIVRRYSLEVVQLSISRSDEQLRTLRMGSTVEVETFFGERHSKEVSLIWISEVSKLETSVSLSKSMLPSRLNTVR